MSLDVIVKIVSVFNCKKGKMFSCRSILLFLLFSLWKSLSKEAIHVGLMFLGSLFSQNCVNVCVRDESK